MSNVAKFSGVDTIRDRKISQDVKISGLGKIPESLECLNFKVSGSAKADNNLLVHGDLSDSGRLKIKGSVEVDENTKISGVMNVFGNSLVHGNLKSSGIFKCKGQVRVYGSVKLTGVAKIFGNLEIGEKFENTGSFRINGNLSAHNVYTDIKFPDKLIFRNITQSKVHGSLKSDGYVELYNVHINGNVYGKNVKIGKNVVVDGTVYYSDELILEDDPILQNPANKHSIEPISTLDDKFEFEVPAKVKTPRFCPKCGGKTEENAPFCAFCGFKFH
ncbi:MAG: hypothetical protein ACTSVU_00880 [Promethearchaeota archaeon]